MPSSAPAEFDEWLCGLSAYSDPPAWRLRVSTGDAVILPTWTPLAKWSVLLIGFAGAMTLCFALAYQDGMQGIAGFFGLASGCMGVLMLVATGCVGFVMLKLATDGVKGAYFVCRPDRRTFELPRHGLTVAWHDAIEWRTVSGNFYGPFGQQRRRNHAMTELQFVAQRPGGAVAYLIAGSSRTSLAVEVEAIAKATGLPFRCVVQHQGIYDASTDDFVTIARARSDRS